MRSVRVSVRVTVFLHLSKLRIYVISRVRPSGRPAVARGKFFSIGHYTQTFQPKFFVPALPIAIIYHFISLSVTLTLPRGQKERKAKPLASFSRLLLN